MHLATAPSPAPAENSVADSTPPAPSSPKPKPNQPDMAEGPGGATVPPKPAPPAPAPAPPPPATTPPGRRSRPSSPRPATPRSRSFASPTTSAHHPGKHDAEIEQAMDRKFDQIWWERIDELFKRRDRLTADIAKKKKALWDETNPDEKKKGLDLVKQMEKDLTKAGDILRKDMDYAADQPPDLTNKAQLADLAKSRPHPGTRRGRRPPSSPSRTTRANSPGPRKCSRGARHEDSTAYLQSKANVGGFPSRPLRTPGALSPVNTC